jgi:hypothetical protein
MVGPAWRGKWLAENRGMQGKPLFTAIESANYLNFHLQTVICKSLPWPDLERANDYVQYWFTALSFSSHGPSHGELEAQRRCEEVRRGLCSIHQRMA